MPQLAEWRDFYTMIGTAAGVIVGATFVVVTLASSLESASGLGLRGFITPIAVHLGSVLIGSAILAVPTLSPLAFAILLGTGGIAGAIYSVIVTTRIWHLKLDVSDWSFYVVLPVLSYLGMAAAALLALKPHVPALEVLSVSLVLLLIVGMRNAWDMATFMITRNRQG